MTKSAEFSDARGEKFNTCFMFIMSQPCNFLRGPGPVWRCVRTERASILTRTRAGLELRKGGSKSLLSLPEPGPVWPCVGTVAKCVRLVANQKVSILRRFATILTPLRAGLAVGRDSRDAGNTGGNKTFWTSEDLLKALLSIQPNGQFLLTQVRAAILKVVGFLALL